jgi:hypothetical protein
MSWKDVIKMPPIENPRRQIVGENDNLSMKEYEELFERLVDPIIERVSKTKETHASISLDELGMSPIKAEKIAKKLYKGKGYQAIVVVKDKLYFSLEPRE